METDSPEITPKHPASPPLSQASMPSVQAAFALLTAGQVGKDAAEDAATISATFTPDNAHGHATLAATATPAVTAAPPAAVAHLAAQIVETLGGQAGTEIALSPEELGHVRLSLRPHDSDPSRIVVMMSFERADAMDLFRRNADQLVADLISAGFTGADLNFAQSGPHGGDTAAHDGSESPHSDATSDFISPTPPTRPSGPLSALDLRL